MTERPDVLCSKLIEGRVAILVDGNPYALIIPKLVSDNFQTVDDYNFKPYFGTFIRWLKYGAFFSVGFTARVLCRRCHASPRNF